VKTIMVTGGLGFVGSNLIGHIFQNYSGYNVLILDALTYAGRVDNIPEKIRRDARFSLNQGNIRDGALVDKLVSSSDIVIHLAAESHVASSISDNAVFFETIVLGTMMIASAVAKHSDAVERFIYFSAADVYGTPIEIPITEGHLLNPRSPYASAKAGADRLVYSYMVTYGIPAIIIRPFGIYGPRQHPEKVIPKFILSALMDKSITIQGNGEQTRDWLYIDDLCQAVDRAIHADLDKVQGEVINIGSGREISVKAIAELVVDRLNKPNSLITYISDRPGQVSRYISSTAKAKATLGWRAKTEFEDGLSRTIDWYQENTAWWKELV
jgi:dTDP-glucose 4,6-dehydratase